MRRLRVIGDANILIAVGEAGLRHCLERIDAVRSGSVGVQNAAQIRGRDERRDLVRRGALDLVQAFAQLRFDVLQARALRRSRPRFPPR